ncbi:MAG: hypothetical protein M3170_00745 [Candidatus Dormibacteraeota bacterium]|nr:hypothetical protein [Candidatus Dormibacteraeota bacterium]
MAAGRRGDAEGSAVKLAVREPRRLVATAGLQQPRRPSPAGAHPAEITVRALLSVAAATALCVAIVRREPAQLSVQTDIVGYPIYADYNIQRVLVLYYAVLGLLPVTAFVLFAGLGGVSRRLGLSNRGSQPRPGPEEWLEAGPAETSSGPRALMAAAGRLLLVGAGFGLEIAMVTGWSGAALWACVATAAVGYAFALSSLAAGTGALGRPRSLLGRVSALNSLIAPLAVLGVALVAAATTVTVQSDGTVHRYAWLPLWAPAAATAGLAAWIAICIRRAGSEAGVRSVERRVVLLLTGSVCIFLLVSALPGALGPMEMFHEGESLAASRLTRAGYFPWRDLMSIHGVLQDQLSPIPGQLWFDDSRWGTVAGRQVLLGPLSLVFVYLYVALLFEQTWPFVATCAVLMLGRPLYITFPGQPRSMNLLAPVTDARFIFWPLLLLLLWAAVRTRRRWLSAALGAALVAEAFLVPESAYLLVAAGVIVAASDLSSRRRGQRLSSAFGRTLWFLAGAGGVAAATLVYLQSQRAFTELAFYYLIFGKGHELTGGLQIHPRAWLADPVFTFTALIPLAAVVLTASYFATALLRVRALGPLDWLMAAAALLVFAYYPKFLDRADSVHVFEVYGACVPLLLILVYRVGRAVQGRLLNTRPGARLASRLTPQPVAWALLVVVLAWSGAGLAARVSQAPTNIRAQVPREPGLASIGYSNDAIDPNSYGDLKAVLGAYLRPGDWIFDFSNEPALYYYLLVQQPHTRYFHVSMAIPEAAQKDLIGELERTRPKLVVFYSDRYGLPQWDAIPNMVRHYDVSQYILDHYRPLLSIDGQVLYADQEARLSPARASRLALSTPPITEGLAFRGLPCDWGAAPNFLRVSPPARPSAPGAAVRIRSTASTPTTLRLAPPAGTSWADYRWLEIDARATGLPADTWTLADQQAAPAQRQISFRTLDGRSGATFKLYVGSCAQWHGYGATPLYLSSHSPPGQLSIRLVP